MTRVKPPADGTTGLVEVAVTHMQEKVRKLNREYALILLGDRPVVLRESIGADAAPEYRLLSVSGFHEWLRPQVYYEGERRKPLSKYWIDSRERRQYDGLVFDPSGCAPSSYYNLWKGFAVAPIASTNGAPKASCQRFLDHVANNVCGGDEALFAWVMGWFAAIVQRPTDKLGTSLVLRGAQGTGKTIVGRVIGSLLGQHYSLVADSRYIVGRFNAHLANCLLLQLDEATWGGDHAAAGKLKDLITGEWQFIEYKGREPVKVRNYVRLLVTGNNNWLVPAGLEERRFAVLDVGDEKRQNHDYFQAIEDELAAGGDGALLHYLLTLDLADIPLRSIPRTGALVEQQVASLPSDQQWWLDILRRGTLPSDTAGTGSAECAALYDHYLERMQRMGVARRHSETSLGIALRRIAPGVLRHKRSTPTAGGTERRYVYEFPPLDKCRHDFERVTGEIDVPEDSPESWLPWSPEKKP